MEILINKLILFFRPTLKRGIIQTLTSGGEKRPVLRALGDGS